MILSGAVSCVRVGVRKAERRTGFIAQVHDQAWFIDLHPRRTRA